MNCQIQVRLLRTIAVLFAVLFCNESYADPAAPDAYLCGQVLDDYGVPVTNINVFAFGQDGVTNTFSAVTDEDGDFQMGVAGGGYFLQLDSDPDVGVLSRGLVSPRVFEMIGSGASVTNVTLVARRITGSITVTLVNAGPLFMSGLVAKQTIDLTGTVTTDNFDSTDPIYTNSLYSPTNKPGTFGTNTTGILDTNIVIYVPPAFISTNVVSYTNFTFHYVSQTNTSPLWTRPNIPITNVEVSAFNDSDSYICTPQVTDTNGTAVLFVCDGVWSLKPDCGALDAMKLDCQLNWNRVAGVTNTNVAITLNYYTNAPLQISMSMAAGTNGVPYNGQLQNFGGYWPFTWAVLGGTLPPGLTLDQSVPGHIAGTPTQEGSYTFTVTVTDNLQQSAFAYVTINILPTPPPQLSAPMCLHGSRFQLQFGGISNRTYMIQFTRDLTNWTTLATTNVAGPDVIFVDTNAADTMRIYRVLQEE